MGAEGAPNSPILFLISQAKRTELTQQRSCYIREQFTTVTSLLSTVNCRKVTSPLLSLTPE